MQAYHPPITGFVSDEVFPDLRDSLLNEAIVPKSAAFCGFLPCFLLSSALLKPAMLPSIDDNHTTELNTLPEYGVPRSAALAGAGLGPVLLTAAEFVGGRVSAFSTSTVQPKSTLSFRQMQANETCASEIPFSGRGLIIRNRSLGISFPVILVIK